MTDQLTLPTRNPFAIARKRDDRDAFGFVAYDALDDIEWWLNKVIGDGPWMKTLSYEYAGFKPETRIYGESAKVKVWRGDMLPNGKPHGSVQVEDGDAVWSLDTTLPTQPTYEELKAAEPDILREAMLLEFGGAKGNPFMLAQLRTPEGKLAWWQAVKLEVGWPWMKFDVLKEAAVNEDG